MSFPFAKLLDEEFLRVAKEEDISLEQLVAEVAGATNYTTRTIYLFRSGKLAIPAELIPYLVQRFKSRNLINYMESLCDCVPVEVPEQFDLARLSTGAVREVL